MAMGERAPEYGALGPALRGCARAARRHSLHDSLTPQSTLYSTGWISGWGRVLGSARLYFTARLLHIHHIFLFNSFIVNTYFL